MGLIITFLFMHLASFFNKFLLDVRKGEKDTDRKVGKVYFQINKQESSYGYVYP